MTTQRKERICALLKGIETGDPDSVTVVHPDKYIQHNPQTEEGGIGLAELFKQLAKTSPQVNIVRVFSDGDFVFAHTEYDFGSPKIGFEIFRFEGDFTVEHWDNIQPRKGPNTAGHSMVDGPVTVDDGHLTEANREHVQSFLQNVLIEGIGKDWGHYFNESAYIEHNPELSDDLSDLQARFKDESDNNPQSVSYNTVHRVLAEGNFVLAVSEGFRGKTHSAFFDLFRLQDGKIVEHWDTTEAVPPRNVWKNQNGKF